MSYVVDRENWNMRRVAVVTAAHKGVGLDIVKGLCKEFTGDVILTAKNEESGKLAVEKLENEGLEPKFYKLDIIEQENIDKLQDFLQENYGGLDVLVNNAAIAPEFSNDERPPFSEEAKKVIDVNYFSTLNVCQTLFPILRPHSRVCNVSSLLSEHSLQNFSDELKAQVKDPNIAIEDVNTIMNQFVEAAQTNEHLDQGFDSSPFGVSNIGVNLMSAIQQKELDAQGADDIVVNAYCPNDISANKTGGGGGRPPELGTPCASTPLYCALLPPYIESPRGEILTCKKPYNWLNI